MIQVINYDIVEKLITKIKSAILKRINVKTIQLSQILKSQSNYHLMKEIKKIFCYWYDKKSFIIIQKHFHQIVRIYNGKYKNYKKCNTNYHDLNHTKDILLACIRLIDGYNLENERITQNLAINLLIAAIYHDVGYIQNKDDDRGTGAKFTQLHVQRSIDFIKKHAGELKISETSLTIIPQLINSTGLNNNLENIDFRENTEIIAGYMLGTADLLGQMAERNYIEKLLFLYYEFKEANIKGYNTEFDILKNTLGFFKLVQKKFHDEFYDVYKYVENHFKKRYNIPRNLYIDAINKHIEYIKKIIEDDSTNFRHKLNRMNWKNNSIFR